MFKSMELVATLIANPKKQPLTAALAQSIVQSLATRGIHTESQQWLSEGVALDLFISSDVVTADKKLQAALGAHAIDSIVQPIHGRRKKLLVADMESTIITIEALDELAEFAGIKEKIVTITARAMNGELDFEAALKERVMLLKNLPEATLQKVLDEKMQIMQGARELVATMKKNGAHCILVSGGFDFFTSHVREMLGFDEDYSNRLEIQNGKLTGHVIPPILGKEAKLQTLNNTCIRLGILPEEALAVGDGANDLPMLLAAGLGVAYHAKPTVRTQAKFRINHANLKALLYAQGYSQ